MKKISSLTPSRVDTIALVREVERRISGGPGSEGHEIHEEGDK